ncbi:uncharacterized protein LOC142558221 [Dermacentor variabilis]|uniref:uncharacterized protein LOC142558221 n=1 Tax=Dermacentor variabilis TaxID=34621 RepID=UPI003F5B8962
MPDTCTGKLLRLRGALGGVNWRPTRFAVGGLHPYACSLCGVIPKHTLLLPCEHALCETCKSGSLEDDGGVCPLDQEPFVEDECGRIPLPLRKLSSLKASVELSIAISWHFSAKQHRCEARESCMDYFVRA